MFSIISKSYIPRQNFFRFINISNLRSSRPSRTDTNRAFFPCNLSPIFLRISLGTLLETEIIWYSLSSRYFLTCRVTRKKTHYSSKYSKKHFWNKNQQKDKEPPKPFHTDPLIYSISLQLSSLTAVGTAAFFVVSFFTGGKHVAENIFGLAGFSCGH